MGNNSTTYKLIIDAEINALESKMSALQKTLAQGMDVSKAASLNEQLKIMGKELDILKDKNNKALDAKGFTELENDCEKYGSAVKKVEGQLTHISTLTNKQKIKLFDNKTQKQIETNAAALRKFTKDKAAAEKKTVALVNAETLLKEAQKKNTKALQQQANAQANLDNATATKDTAGQNLAAKLKVPDADTALKRIDKYKNDAANGNTKAENKLKQIEQEIQAYEQAAKAVETYQAKLDAAEKRVQATTQAENTASASVKTLTASYKTLKDQNIQTAFEELRATVEATGTSLKGVGTNYTDAEFQKLQATVDQVTNQALTKFNTACKNGETQSQELSQEINKTNTSLEQQEDLLKQTDATFQAASGITSYLQRFVGLTGAMTIFTKVMRNAFQTTKELDAQMTEMAVVTKSTIQDYWNQLPQYTERANQLGVAIKDTYEAATLYYQQGLTTNQVIGVSNATLKMARIANLDAAEATNKMTAALRGFNMEVNETNATKVADVYSQLAAITASDVEEISTAMTRTASLASNAGMQFETTAAFLSQIIETTRESAETAGTALKTVIARFQELKKSPSEIGEVDGEIIDANKIETALRSVGVALRDEEGQFRDLDSVFLELAQKWDTLDTNTQRYIATIAAGSRQQSRFIAMMSDFGRTQELVSAAQNSAGASASQYEKTLDSLQTALNKLQNAWDTLSLSWSQGIFTELISRLATILDLFSKMPKLIQLAFAVPTLLGANTALQAFLVSLKEGNSLLTALGAGLKAPFAAFNTSVMTAAKRMQEYKKVTQETVISEQALKAAQQDLVKAQNNLGAATAKLNSQKRKSQKARKAEAKAQAEVAAAQEAADEAQQKHNANQVQAIILDNRYITVEEKKALAAKFGNQVALSGLSTDTQRLLLMSNLTQQEAEDLLLIASKNGLSANQVVIDALVTKGIITQAQAEEIKNKISKKSIFQILAEIGANILLVLSKKTTAAAAWTNIKAILAESAAQVKQTICTYMQVGANVSLLASLGPIALVLGIILVVILAIVAVIWLIIKGIKLLIANSPEGKLESAAEATEAAKESAESAAEAYNDLKDAFDSLDENYDALNELTVGTQEWRDKLFEVNQQVMDLIEQYPELAKYVSMTSDGLMELDLNADNVKKILSDVENTKFATQGNVAAKQIRQIQAQENADYDNLDLFKRIRISTASEGELGKTFSISGGAKPEFMSREQTDKYAKAITEGLMSKEDVIKRGYSEETYDLLKDWGLKLHENSLAIQGYTQAVEASAIAIAGKNMTDKGVTQATVAVNAAVQEAVRKKLETPKISDQDKKLAAGVTAVSSALLGLEIGSLLGKGQLLYSATTNEYEDLTDEQKKDYADYVQSTYGSKAKIDSESGKITYTNADGDKVKISYKDEFEQFKDVLGTQELARVMEKMPAAIESASKAVSKENRQSFLKIYDADEGKALNQADINNLQTLEYTKIWESMSQEERDLWGDKTIWAEQITSAIDLASNAYTKAAEDSIRVFGKELVWNEQLNAGSVQALTDMVINIADTQGVAAAEAFQKTANDFLNTVPTEMRDTVALQMSSLMESDDIRDFEQFGQTLRDLGVAVNQSQLDALTETMIDLAGASRNIDLETLQNAIGSIMELVETLQSSSLDYTTVEAETYQQLVTIAPKLKDSFQQIGDSWAYMGSMSDLLSTITGLDTEIEDAIKGNENKLNAKNALTEYYTNLGHSSLDEMYNVVGPGILESALDAVIKNSSVSEATAGKMTDTSIKNQGDVKRFLDLINSYNSAELESNIKETKALQSAYGYNDTVYSNVAKGNYGMAAAQLAKNGVPEATLKEIYAGVIALERSSANKDSAAYKKQEAALTEALNLLANYDSKRTAKNNYAEFIAALGESLATYESGTQVERETAMADIANTMGLDATVANMELAKRLIQNDAKAVEDYYKLIAAQSDGTNKAIANGVAYYKDASTAIMMDAQQLENITDQIIDESDVFWQNTFNWLDALEQKTTNLQRKREEAERKYEKSQDKYFTSQDNYNKALESMIAQMRKEYQLADVKQASAQSALDQLKNNEFYNYVDWDTFTATGGLTGGGEVLAKNVDNKTFLSDKGSEFEEYLQEIRDIVSKYYDAATEKWKLEDEYEEMKQDSLDAYEELLSRLRDAILDELQKQIDEMSNLNDAINEAQDKMLSKMEEQINNQREAREDEKTRTDLEDKRQKLLQLMQDSSGKNQLEVQKLQEEIANDEQSYQDSIVDKTLEEMRSANEEAAAQREQQISNQEAMLEIFTEFDSWTKAEAMLKNSLGSEEFLETDAAKKIAAFEGYEKSANSRTDLMKKLETLGAKAAWDKKNGIKVDGSNPIPVDVSKIAGQKPTTGTEEIDTEYQNWWIENGDELVSLLKQLADMNPLYGDAYDTKLTEEDAPDVQAYADANDLSGNAYNQNVFTDASGKRYYWSRRRRQMIAFASGGLVDFTGPAWLDGTSSKPEMVLNANDTANFIDLKNALSHLAALQSNGNITNSGSNYYDVQIDVGELASDYDVEQVAAKIKSLIVDDATARGVNALSR